MFHGKAVPTRVRPQKTGTAGRDPSDTPSHEFDHFIMVPVFTVRPSSVSAMEPLPLQVGLYLLLPLLVLHLPAVVVVPEDVVLVEQLAHHLDPLRSPVRSSPDIPVPSDLSGSDRVSWTTGWGSGLLRYSSLLRSGSSLSSTQEPGVSGDRPLLRYLPFVTSVSGVTGLTRQDGLKRTSVVSVPPVYTGLSTSRRVDPVPTKVSLIVKVTRTFFYPYFISEVG